MNSMQLLTPSRIAMVLLYALAAVIAAGFPVPFVYGIEIYLIHSIAWFIYRRHGYQAALAFSFLAAVSGLFLWEQSPLIVLFPIEVYMVHWFAARFKRSHLTADLIYWLSAGLLLWGLGYFWVTQTAAPYLVLFLIIQAGSGLFNTMIGDLAADYIPSFGNGTINACRIKRKLERLSIQLCILLLITPLSIYLYLSGKHMYQDALTNTTDKMNAVYVRVNEHVNELTQKDMRDFLVHSSLQQAALLTTFKSLTINTDLKLILVDSDDHVIAARDPSVSEGEVLRMEEGSLVKESETLSLWKPERIPAYSPITEWSNSEWLGVYPLERVPFRLVIKQPVASFQQSVFSLLTDSLLLLLPVVLLTALGAVWAVRRFTRSLKELARLSTGLPDKIRTRSPLEWKDSKVEEVSALYHNFVEMSAGLSKMFSEINQSEEKLRMLAHYDSLTGLANRTSFSSYLPALLQEAQKNGEKAACLFIDLDGFKAINDTHGHAAGDQVIMEIGQRLQPYCNEHTKAFRLSGDEFVVVLREPLPVNLKRWADHLHEALVSRAVEFNQIEIPIGFSAGLALFPEHGRDAESLMRSADTAMYQVKLSGRNNIRILKEREVKHHE